MPQEFVWQGCHNKIETFEDVLIRAQLEASEVAFIGDDVTDIPIMQRVGLAVAVADAEDGTKRAAHFVTERTAAMGLCAK